MTEHIPVLLKEVAEGLALKKGDTALDATVGGGGHAAEICSRIGETGILVGVDMDEAALRRAEAQALRGGCTARFSKVNFRNLDVVLEKEGIREIDKALFDLGVCSFEMEAAGRGFSFRRDEPLLMTFDSDPNYGVLTAGEIINEWSEEEITRILREYGEERVASRIAQALVARRAEKRIERTAELAEIVNASIPARFRRGDSPAKTFQALRIAVNDELDALREGLMKATERLASGGRIAGISFHSLEDRIAKQYFRGLAAQGGFVVLTKKPIVPSAEETGRNPRARSAKLRIIEKERIGYSV